jgi:chromosomal replication initiator protein
MQVDQDRLWQAVLGDIEITLSRANYLTWFRNTQLLRHDADKLVVGVPNVFIKQQLEKKYNELVTTTLRKNGVDVPTVEYKIQSVARKTAIDDPISLPRSASLPGPSASSSANGPMGGLDRTMQPSLRATNTLTHAYRQGINERYTFDNFVVGSGNELAHAACQAIAANPGTKYNPLFLYGGSGGPPAHPFCLGHEHRHANARF